MEKNHIFCTMISSVHEQQCWITIPKASGVTEIRNEGSSVSRKCLHETSIRDLGPDSPSSPPSLAKISYQTTRAVVKTNRCPGFRGLLLTSRIHSGRRAFRKSTHEEC